MDRICVGEHTVQSRHLGKKKNKYKLCRQYHIYCVMCINRRFHVLAGLQGQGAGWPPLQGPGLREQHRGGQAGEDVLLPLPLVQPPRLLLRGGGHPQAGGVGPTCSSPDVNCELNLVI